MIKFIIKLKKKKSLYDHYINNMRKKQKIKHTLCCLCAWL